MVKSGLLLEEGPNDQVNPLGNDEDADLDLEEGTLEDIESVLDLVDLIPMRMTLPACEWGMRGSSSRTDKLGTEGDVEPMSPRRGEEEAQRV